jgi:hypothetical protein
MRPKLVFPLAGPLLPGCIGFHAASDGQGPTTAPAALRKAALESAQKVEAACGIQP